MTTTWEAIAAVTATTMDPQLSTDGVTQPQVEVSITGTGTQLHVHVATLGPEGDVPETRLTAFEARQLAQVLVQAAKAVERVA